MALDDFTILSHLDIYREVGLATAHDEVIPFIVKNNAKKLKIHDSEVPIRNGKVNLRFLRVCLLDKVIKQLPANY